MLVIDHLYPHAQSIGFSIERFNGLAFVSPANALMGIRITLSSGYRDARYELMRVGDAINRRGVGRCEGRCD